MKFTKENVKRLPDAPGIYLFYSQKKKLLYVGKATSLKSRVSSYLTGKSSSRPIEELIDEVATLKHKETDSVLEAIILEALYIKKYKPKHNILGRDDKSWNYIVITKDEYPMVKTTRSHEFAQLTTTEKRKKYAHIFGPFPGMNTKATMKLLQQIFGFCSCKPGQKSCLYFQMNQCLGVFQRSIAPAQYKKQAIQPLIAFLNGKKASVIKEFKKQMTAASKKQDFETAARYRNQLARLERIHDVVLINKSFFDGPKKATDVSRIEGYDISNLGASGKVGSMVVFLDGAPAPSHYRLFNIRTVKGQSDVDCLAEVLERRLAHPEWRYPDLFLVDGGKPQLNKARQVLRAAGVQIPVIGIAKGPLRKKNEFHFDLRKKKLKEFVMENEQTLTHVRDEAHRFAIKQQRRQRRIRPKSTKPRPSKR